jgi:hypothetical protein
MNLAKMKRYAVILFLLLQVLALPALALTEPGKNSLKVLFVGNSYTFFNNLPQIVSIMTADENTRLITRKSVAGGASLSDHWRGERGLKTQELIKDGNFDIVVLQEASMGPLTEADTMKKYTKLFCDLIRKKRAKAYLFVTWARKANPRDQKKIDSVYSAAASANGAVLAPVGRAWANAMQQKPEIEFYENDKSHPNELGTLITASVIVETILHQLPYKLPLFYYTFDEDKESLLLMHADEQDAAFCRKIAVETVNPK